MVAFIFGHLGHDAKNFSMGNDVSRIRGYGTTVNGTQVVYL
jgi:hypothetical protein